MGCDIHCYIEFYSREDSQKNSNPWVHSFSSGELDFCRNYTLFGCLAGVRSLVYPEISPRGIPKSPRLSYAASSEYYILILSDEDYAKYTKDRHANYYYNWNQYSRVMSKSQLDEIYISKGYKVDIEIFDGVELLCNPDLHTPTWFYLNELKKIRKAYLIEYATYWSELSKKKSKELLKFINSKNEFELMNYVFSDLESSCLYTVISTMESMEKCNPDTRTRFVCWFDS
jgi:hypothetical protein